MSVFPYTGGTQFTAPSRSCKLQLLFYEIICVEMGRTLIGWSQRSFPICTMHSGLYCTHSSQCVSRRSLYASL